MGTFQKLWKSPATRDKRLMPTVILLVITAGCIAILLHWCHLSNSMVLLAYAVLCYFHLLSLLTCLLSVWVASRLPDLAMSYGYERCETLAVFSTTVLVQLAAMFVAISCAERLLNPPDIATGRLLAGAALGLVCQLLSVFCARNRALQHAVEVSPASWLQEQCADICNGVCGVVPGLARRPVPRVPSLPLLAAVGAAVVAAAAAAVDARQYRLADPLAALVLVVCVWLTMMPLCVNVGRSLLQTTPAHVVSQLDKCLREALTLDGVLEFRHEHFWTLSTGALAGSLHVRIRRDASEQEVLTKVSAMFAPLIHVLTVQVFKDDWARSLTTLQLLNSSALTLEQTSIGSRPPPARVRPAADGGASVAAVCNGAAPPPAALAGGDQRIHLSQLDETATAAPPSDALSYYVSGDGGLPRWTNGGAAVAGAGAVPLRAGYR